MSSFSSSPNLTFGVLEGVEADTTTVILTVVQLMYGIPSIMLMSFFLVFLGCRKSYTNSFYRVVQLDLLTNILCYLNTWLAIRLEKHQTGIAIMKSLESTVPGCVTLSRYFANWFMHMQFCSAAALSFHRITSVVFHSTYDAKWNRYYPMFGVACCLYSALQELILPGKTSYVIIENDVLVRYLDVARAGNALTLVALFSVAYFVLLVGVNVLTSVLVTRTFKSVSFTDHGVAKKLTKIAVTYSVIYMGILSWSVTSALNSKYQFFTNTIFTNSGLLTFASDLMTLALPYILLTFDSNVRNDVCWRGKKVTPVQVSPATTKV